MPSGIAAGPRRSEIDLHRVGGPHEPVAARRDDVARARAPAGKYRARRDACAARPSRLGPVEERLPVPGRRHVERDLVVLDPEVAVADDDARPPSSTRRCSGFSSLLSIQLRISSASSRRASPKARDEERRDLLGILDPQTGAARSSHLLLEDDGAPVDVHANPLVQPLGARVALRVDPEPDRTLPEPPELAERVVEQRFTEAAATPLAAE